MHAPLSGGNKQHSASILLLGTFVPGKKKTKNILLQQREREREREYEGKEKAGERRWYENGGRGRKEDGGGWREGRREGNAGEKQLAGVWVPGGAMGGVFSAQGP